MRSNLPFGSLILGAALLTTITTAGQQPDRFAYAVTENNPQGGADWSFLRKLNLQTGEYSNILLSGNNPSLLAFNAATKKQFAAPLVDAQFGNAVNAAFATGVAAMAYHKKNDRLYYTPMFIDQLRYIDLKSMNVFYVTDLAFTGKPQKSSDQGNIVTRMVIASDGNGYAMTNDGMQLIRFTTGKKMQVTDLGSVVDDQANKDASIHASCTSFGGDMVADDNGSIYLFSARNHVFKINTDTKVATHLGIVSGLPANFSINGAAVNDENKVVVTSAAFAAGAYTLDSKTWSATPYTINGIAWQSSDLANSNLLLSGQRPNAIESDVISTKTTISGESHVSLYPNPVMDKKFTLQFNQLRAGKYTVLVTDVMGRQVLQQTASVGGDNQSHTVRLATTDKGVYLVKVTDVSNKTVFTSKVVVQ